MILSCSCMHAREPRAADTHQQCVCVLCAHRIIMLHMRAAIWGSIAPPSACQARTELSTVVLLLRGAVGPPDARSPIWGCRELAGNDSHTHTHISGTQHGPCLVVNATLQSTCMMQVDVSMQMCVSPAPSFTMGAVSRATTSRRHQHIAHASPKCVAMMNTPQHADTDTENSCDCRVGACEYRQQCC